MANYKKMYAIMVHAADEAATLLESCDYTPQLDKAYRLLTEAMLECEEIYIETEDDSDRM